MSEGNSRFVSGRSSINSSELFGHLDRVTRAAPELISHARDVLERAIEFQQHHFEEHMSRAGGKRELEARAFAEYQKSKRTEAAIGLVRGGFNWGRTGGPSRGERVELMTAPCHHRWRR